MIILIGIFGLVFGFIFAYSCESLGWDSFNIVYAIPMLILFNFLSFRGKTVCHFVRTLIAVITTRTKMMTMLVAIVKTLSHLVKKKMKIVKKKIEKLLTNPKVSDILLV